jgi:hypothetical protein
MADVVLTKQRVAPEGKERLREWMAEVKSRESEALETLANEGMVAEAAFLDEQPDGTYLLYYMEANDVDEVQEAFESSPYDIDREHAAVLSEVAAEDQPDEQPELLYHLVNGEAAREQDEGFSSGGVDSATDG